jgi:hypothetical protein
MKKGLLRSTAIVAVAVAGFSSAAHAGMLEAMEQMMAASGTPDNAFTYDSVVSNTDSGFEITGVKMEPEPGQGVVTIDVLRVDALDMAASEAGTPPTFMDFSAEGVRIPPEALDPETLAVFPDGITFDMGIDYRFDPVAATLNLEEFSFSMPRYGDVAISAELAGLTMESIAGAMFAGPEALSGVTIHSASITLDDEGGLAELFGMAAADEGMDLDTFVNAAMMPQLEMMGMMFAADPAGASVFESVLAFLGDYADPQGPLTITARPSSPVSLASLMQLADPTGLPSLLGLGSSYDGGVRQRDLPQPSEPEAPDQQGSLFGQDAQGRQRAEAEPSPQPAPATPGGDGAFATLLALATAGGMPEGALTYDAVVSDSPDGFILSNVRLEPEPGDYIEIGTLSVSKIDMESIRAGMPPLALQLSAIGLVVPSADPDMYEIFQGEPVSANVHIDYVLDPATGDFDVNAIALELVDLATISLTLNMTGVSPDAIASAAMEDPGAFATALIEGATLAYNDEGLVQRMVAMQAELDGVSEQSLIDETLAGLDEAAPMFQTDPIASAAIRALRDFIADYRAPRGPIAIMLAPPSPVSLAEIENVMDPSQIPQMLGLMISY